MIRILIVEDEEAISNLIKISLVKHGYHCDISSDGTAAIDRIETHQYDLILLDVMLPEIDGYELMDYIRPFGIPVIFITAKNSVNDRVKGLYMGAEDYIVKPFEVIELIARVEVVLRRTKKVSGTIEICKLLINTDSMQVSRDGIPIHLTKKEYDLLLLFVQNPNMALYRDTIYNRVWGGDYLPESKTVDLHVQRLRKKVGLEKELQAVNKVGYRLMVES